MCRAYPWADGCRHSAAQLPAWKLGSRRGRSSKGVGVGLVRDNGVGVGLVRDKFFGRGGRGMRQRQMLHPQREKKTHLRQTTKPAPNPPLSPISPALPGTPARGPRPPYMMGCWGWGRQPWGMLGGTPNHDGDPTGDPWDGCHPRPGWMPPFLASRTHTHTHKMATEDMKCSFP